MYRVKRLVVAIGIAACLVWVPGLAQEETAEPSGPPRHPGPMMMHREGAPPGEMPPGGIRGPRKGGARRELSAEERDKLLKFLKEHVPGEWKRLQRVREEQPGDFKRHVAEQWRSLMKLMMIQKRSPELFRRIVEQRKLEMKSREIAGSLRRAKTEEEKEAIGEELTGVLGDLLDLQHEQWEEQIKALEKRLDELRDMLRKRSENRDEIIRRRMAGLTGEEDYLDWTFPKWAEVGLPPTEEGEERPGEAEEVSPPKEGGER